METEIKVQFIWKCRNSIQHYGAEDQSRIEYLKVRCKTNRQITDVDDDFYTHLVCDDKDVIRQFIDDHYRNKQVDSETWDIIDAHVELLSDVDTQITNGRMFPTLQNTLNGENQYFISVPLLDNESNSTIYIPIGKMCVIYKDTCHTIESISVIKESLLPTIVDVYFNNMQLREPMLLPEEIYTRYSIQSEQKFGLSCRKQNKNYYIRRKV